MTNKHHNQRGFAHHLALALVVVLAVLGYGAYRVYNADQTKKLTLAGVLEQQTNCQAGQQCPGYQLKTSNNQSYGLNVSSGSAPAPGSQVQVTGTESSSGSSSTPMINVSAIAPNPPASSSASPSTSNSSSSGSSSSSSSSSSSGSTSVCTMAAYICNNSYYLTNANYGETLTTLIHQLIFVTLTSTSYDTAPPVGTIYVNQTPWLITAGAINMKVVDTTSKVTQDSNGQKTTAVTALIETTEQRQTSSIHGTSTEYDTCSAPTKCPSGTVKTLSWYADVHVVDTL